jgi:GntR family transcriptional regulator
MPRMQAEQMYRQIASDLRNMIKSGEIRRGGQLPTEIELMERYNASGHTVREAIKVLAGLRLVETRAGQGTYVVETITPFIMPLTGDPHATRGEDTVYLAEAAEAGRKPRNSEPRVEVQTADEATADALQVGPGSRVIRRHQRRFLDDIPWSLQTSFYPMSLIEQGASRLIQARNIGEGVMAYLSNDLGIKQVGYSDTVKVRLPDEVEAAFFKLPSDGRVSVFAISRIGFGEGQKPPRLTVAVLPADRNHLRIEVGQVPQRGGIDP